jgi:hypothetical protein
MHQILGVGNRLHYIALGQAEQIAAFQFMRGVVNGIAGLPLDDIGKLIIVHLFLPNAPARTALTETIATYVRHKII